MEYEIDFLSVGENSNSGDAIALRYGNFTTNPHDQRVVIIDGGYAGNGDDLVTHVTEYYATTRVDLVVSTHPDQDHIGGLSTVLDELHVNDLWMHRPWEHTDRIRDMFHDGRITDESLSRRFRASMEQAWEFGEKGPPAGDTGRRAVCRTFRRAPSCAWSYRVLLPRAAGRLWRCLTDYGRGHAGDRIHWFTGQSRESRRPVGE